MEAYILSFLEIMPGLLNQGIFVDVLQRLEKFKCRQPFIFLIDHASVILCYTFILHDYFPYLHYLAFIISAAFLLVNLVAVIYFIHRHQINSNPSDIIAPTPDRNKNLDMASGITYLLTCIAIFAVDMPYFYSKARKSSYFGIGLMDTGIGLFVHLMGLKSIGNKWKEASTGTRWQISKRVLKVTGILVIMGFVRYSIMKWTKLTYSYTEYGIHSNVFFVLAAVKLIGSMVDALTVKYIRPVIVGFVILAIYEIALTIGLYRISFFEGTDLRAKENIFMANIESFLCVIGLVGIFMVSKQMGDRYYNDIHSSPKSKLWNALEMLLFCILLSTINRTLYYMGLVVLESRRLANWSYAIWMISMALFFESMVKIFQIYHNMKYPNYVHYMQKISKMGLTYFVMANILVGSCRLIRPYITIPNWSSVFVIYIYSTLNYFIALYCDRFLTYFYNFLSNSSLWKRENLLENYIFKLVIVKPLKIIIRIFRRS